MIVIWWGITLYLFFSYLFILISFSLFLISGNVFETFLWQIIKALNLYRKKTESDNFFWVKIYVE